MERSITGAARLRQERKQPFRTGFNPMLDNRCRVYVPGTLSDYRSMSKTDSQVMLISGSEIAAYGFADGHPFGQDRHTVFMDELRLQSFASQLLHAAPRLATVDELAAFHTREYIEFVRERCDEGEGALDGGDTPAQTGLFEAASFVVGATLHAVEAIMTQQARAVFIPIAGLHHAARDHAAGFCVFNDIGVAIEVLRSKYGIKRIAYVDIDAHHGDGVYYAFADDPEVFIADLHQDGRSLYPGTGTSYETGVGKAQGTKLNLPLPPYADDATFVLAWQQALTFIEATTPELIILQCGADSIEGDPLAQLMWSPNAHAQATRDLCVLAAKLGHHRVLALGGGGYNRRNLAVTWTGVVRELVNATFTSVA
jgi:acetoin utilization protein AcuC